jgi:inorganic triphosphatase YgiF
MTANQEIELKFELEGDEDASRRLREELERRFGPGKAVQLASTYFDTADLALREAAMSLRVRRTGARRLQTVKGPAADGEGLFARAEWEREIEADRPDLASVADTPLAALLAQPEVMHGLGPAFESQVERIVWDVAEGDGAFELALDRGVITADGRSSPVRELEIELKSGDPESLLSLARSLDAVAALRLGGRSKADRGYQLLEKTDRSAIAAERLVLTPDMTVGEGFQAIARGCVRHFMLNEPLLIRTRSEDALHQTRVALRRLRSALSLFRPAVADGEFETLKARLQAVARQLGTARDIDVFLRSLHQEEEAGDQAALALAAQVRAEREDAYDDAVTAMAAPDARRLMFDLAVWIEAGAWTRAEAGAPSRAPLPEFAAEALNRRRRKLKGRGGRLDRLSAEERHQVRIDAKKLRYAVEFFAGLYPEKKARRRAEAYLDSLKALQQDLGELNDIARAQDLTHALAAGFAQRKGGPAARRELIYAAGREAGRRQAAAPRLLAAATEAFARFRHARPFWR